MDSQGHDFHTVFETGHEMAHQLSMLFSQPIMAHPDAEGRHQFLIRRDAPLLLEDLNG